MVSSKEYLDHILERLSELDAITYKTMMGEFIIYYCGKIVGGIYDNRFFVKPVESAKEYMPVTSYEWLYEGAKRMLLVENINSKEYLSNLSLAIYDIFHLQIRKKEVNMPP